MGQSLNLAPTSTYCPPGYHWEATTGPIMGVTRRMGAMAACVKDPTPAPAPVKKQLNLHLAPAAPPAAAPAPVKKQLLHLGPAAPAAPASTAASFAPAAAPTSDTVEAPAEEPETASCPPCWPWWWLLVAAAGGATVVAVARSGKGKKKDGRKMNPVVARMVNAGTHHVIRAVMR